MEKLCAVSTPAAPALCRAQAAEVCNKAKTTLEELESGRAFS